MGKRYFKRSHYRMSLDGMLLPIMPGKITFTYPGKNETIDLINGGEINQIKTPGLTEVEFECYIPQVPYPFADYRDNKFRAATYYLNKFEKLKKSKKPFRVIIHRVLPDATPTFDTKKIIFTLEEYTVTEDADNGTDLLVSVKLKQYRKYGPQKLKPIDNGKDGKNKAAIISGSNRKSKTPATSYIVKEGDSLWRIAKKQLNNANKRKDIYTLNKSVIEATAKKNGRASSSNGHWIYPGTKLKLPS